MNKIENAELSDRAVNQISDVIIPMIKKRDKEIEKLKEENNLLRQRNEKAIVYLLNNKLYCFKYDDEELFEITTDKKAKDDLLNILQGADKK